MSKKRNNTQLIFTILTALTMILISCKDRVVRENDKINNQVKNDSIIKIDSSISKNLNENDQLLILEENDNLKVKYNLDTTQSILSWYCVTHHGHIRANKGYIITIGDKIAEGSIEIIMNSFSIDDIDYYLMRETLANTLKSSDFFDVKNHPLSKFQLTHLKKVSENFYFASGDLMIKGIVQKIYFKCTITKAGNKIMLISDKFSFDRTKWGITLYSKNYPQTDDSFLFTDQIDFQVYLIFN